MVTRSTEGSGDSMINRRLKSVVVLVSLMWLVLVGCDGAITVAAEPSPAAIGDVTSTGGADTQSALLDPTGDNDQPVISRDSTEEADSPPDYTGPTYATNIQSIVERVCGACHGSGKTAGLKLTTYEGIMQGSYYGPVIVPGSPEDSELVQRQRRGHYRQLSDEELTLVITWISSGAPE